jgi:hypothetical protein
LPLTNLEQRDAQIAAIGGSERAAYRAQRRSNKTVSEAEAQSNCGIDVVALKIAVSQSAIHVREHQPGVEIRLRGKLPIDNAGDRVERTGALRVLAAGAGTSVPVEEPSTASKADFPSTISRRMAITLPIMAMKPITMPVTFGWPSAKVPVSAPHPNLVPMHSEVRNYGRPFFKNFRRLDDFGSHARLIAALFFAHSRRQLFANAAIAASRFWA